MKNVIWTIKNAAGAQATICSYGARLMRLQLPNAAGDLDDVVLGFDDVNQFKTAREKYCGAIVGRFANRIAQGEIRIGETTYLLEKNEGEHHLHGGSQGFHTVDWQLNNLTDSTIELSYVSPHLSGGYPGQLTVRVTYHLFENNTLRLEFCVETDRDTVVNLTHHPFFHLDDSPTIDAHQLQLMGSEYLEVDEDNIPTGKFLSTGNSEFNFRELHSIGSRKIDHCFILEGNTTLNHAARLYSDRSSRCMDVYTSQPGLQIYTSDYLVGQDVGFNNKKHNRRSAICLEPQYFPDSPNHEHFQSTLLKAGEVYSECIEYRFTNTKIVAEG